MYWMQYLIWISGKILQKLFIDDGQFLCYAKGPYVLNQNCITLFYLLQFTNNLCSHVYLANSAQVYKRMTVSLKNTSVYRLICKIENMAVEECCFSLLHCNVGFCITKVGSRYKLI